MDQPYIYPHHFAVCTLADTTLNNALQSAIANKPELSGLIIAPLTTENIGIEQIIEFCLGQPQLRLLLLCGEEAEQAIGWHAGGTLSALIQHGITGHQNKVIKAPGKRPVLKNLTPEAIEHFRKQMTVWNAIGEQRVETILTKIEELKHCVPKPFAPYTGTIHAQRRTHTVPSTDASIVSDPAGYVVIEVVPNDTSPIHVAHYTPQGEHLTTYCGTDTKSLYVALLEKNAITRLDHAAYLGKELARAEWAYHHGQPYVQDTPTV